MEETERELSTRRNADKEFYLALLDEGTQRKEEEAHLCLVLGMLRRFYISKYKKQIKKAQDAAAALKAQEGYAAGELKEILSIEGEIAALEKKIDGFKCFFQEPYFARMDVVDEKEGYHAYYIGKKGDVNLEIVDWRAPLAVRYYQKSCVSFRINDYNYRTVMRRALDVKNGKLLSFRNEYLSVRDVLSSEEIAGRDEEILFDPYLRTILQERKEDDSIRDIIRTIQEKQFEVITRPERENFVLQGCAGSGKTMIMLHRLSYLMYNNDELSPRDVLVLTPSDSFNAFIEELSKVLELQKVSTTTLTDYYFRILKGEGADLKDKAAGARESEGYLAFLYGEEFPRALEKEIGKLFDGVSGFFTGEECRALSEEILSDAERRQKLYARIKNSSVRIRKCVLGDLKENGQGGFYFTKPFRALMSAFVGVEDFLRFVLAGELRTPDYFFRQFSEFYRCAKEIALHASKIFARAQEDLSEFLIVLDKEISDLKRYRRRQGEEEIYTYAERIAAREALKEETGKIAETVTGMEEGVDLFCDFFEALKTSPDCLEAGKCENTLDVFRMFYRRTVKKYKQKYGMKGLYPSDGYALCSLLAAAGRTLTPRYGLVFVDEGQDISKSEYALLKKINPEAAFNVFGDLKQNITPFRGMKEWDESFGAQYVLTRNYRNTNEIVSLVTKIEGTQMTPVGMHGEEVKRIRLKGVGGFFKNKAGLKAVIAREEDLPLFDKRGYSRLSKAGKLSKSKINVMTVFESKGLEFSAVAVLERGMTENERYIAYTRALYQLAIVEN